MKKFLLLVGVSLLLVLVLIAGCAQPATPGAPTTKTVTTTATVTAGAGAPVTKTVTTTATVTATAPKPQYQWRFTQCTVEEGASLRVASDKFVEELERLSDGRMNIDYYIGSQLGEWDWVMEQVAMGTIEMAINPAPTAMDPRLAIQSVYYLASDWDSISEAIGPGGWLVPICANIAEDVGWKLLGLHCSGMSGIMTKKEITPTPDWVKANGIKMRAMSNKAEEEGGKALDFLVTTIPWGELHTALATGVVDAASGSTIQFLSTFADVAPYWYMYNQSFNLEWAVMNPGVWNNLPPEDQGIVQQALDNALAYEWETLKTNFAKAEANAFKDHGVTVVHLSPDQMAANVQAVRDKQWSFLETVLGAELMNEIKSRTPSQ